MSEQTNETVSVYKAKKAKLFLLISTVLAVIGLCACRRPDSRTIHVQGNHNIIVGTANSLAQSAGHEALLRGGSAADAVLTASLTSIVLEAGAPISYGGIFTMVYYDVATNKYYNLNAGYNTVLGEGDPMSIPQAVHADGSQPDEKPIPSGRTALVPGYMAGVEAAHQRFGRLPFKSLFEPAIYYAGHGFKINPLLSNLISSDKQILSRLPETKRIFTDKNGVFLKSGDDFRQPELAATLRAVANQGFSYMYKGQWANNLVAAIQRDGGRMSLEDLRNYRVIWAEPIKISHGGFEIYVHGLPAYGGVSIAEALNLAKEANIAAY